MKGEPIVMYQTKGGRFVKHWELEQIGLLLWIETWGVAKWKIYPKK